MFLLDDMKLVENIYRKVRQSKWQEWCLRCFSTEVLKFGVSYGKGRDDGGRKRRRARWRFEDEKGYLSYVLAGR
jgi:hypothetical protein